MDITPEFIIKTVEVVGAVIVTIGTWSFLYGKLVKELEEVKGDHEQLKSVVHTNQVDADTRLRAAETDIAVGKSETSNLVVMMVEMRNDIKQLLQRHPS